MGGRLGTGDLVVTHRSSMGHVLSRGDSAQRAPPLKPTSVRLKPIFDISIDGVVLAPTTARLPPMARAFRRLGRLAPRSPSSPHCPSTWPWNLLGWRRSVCRRGLKRFAVTCATDGTANAKCWWPRCVGNDQRRWSEAVVSCLDALYDFLATLTRKSGFGR